MRIKLILSVIFLLTIVIFTLTSLNVNSSTDVPSKITSPIQTSLTNLELPNNITSLKPFNDERNAWLISDKVAYTMVFWLLSSYSNDTERKRLTGYIRQNLDIKDNADIEAVFKLAADYKQPISPIDNQITTLKDRYHTIGHPPFSNKDIKQLEKLRKDKEKIIDDLITDIPRHLSRSGKDELNQSIQLRVKPKIKLE